MQRYWRTTLLALSLGMISLAAIPAAQADPPRDHGFDAANNFRPDDRARFDQQDRARFEDRLRDIDRQRAELNSQEQNLRAQLENERYGWRNSYDRDRIVADLQNIQQRENALAMERNNMLSSHAFDQRDSHDRDGDRR